MAIDKKATLTYVQLMKEDLAVFRLVPEDGVIPDTTQVSSLLLACLYPQKTISLFEEHIQWLHILKTKNS